MKYFTLALFSFSLVLLSCEKDDIQLDKQIRLEFGGPSTGSYMGISDTSWYLVNNPDYVLVNFDKSNYSQLSSVTFSASIWSDNASNYCSVELYNLTDGNSIPNSIITSNQRMVNSYADYIESDNFINSLPDKPIDIAVRIKSSEADQPVYLCPSMIIFLYRK